MDTYLVYRLTNGQVFRTDISNAARTGLYHLEVQDWDPKVCADFRIPLTALPAVIDSDGDFGTTTLDGLMAQSIPITSVISDPGSRLLAAKDAPSGRVQAFLGRDAHLTTLTGTRETATTHGLERSILWNLSGKNAYVLEGYFPEAGAALDWLRDALHLFTLQEDPSDLAQQAQATDQTLLVPAFSAPGAPHWKSAMPLLAQMTRHTGRAELLRAAFESIALQTDDVLRAMREDLGGGIREITVQGPLAAYPYLMQRISDLTALPVKAQTAAQTQQTALQGILCAAGASAGLYADLGVPTAEIGQSYTPQISDDTRTECRARWRAALDQASRS